MLKKEFTLRPYQQTFNRNIAIAVRDHRRVIACAATGAGKSKTFLSIAVNAVNKKNTVLVITESRKIYKQLIAEVHAFEIKPGSNPPIIQERIYLAMAQTLRRRPKLIEKFKGFGGKLLIINDECHVNEATNLLEQLGEAMLIGFSGSPVGKHLVKLYSHLVVGPQPHELVLEGFLTPYKHFERNRADITQLELDNKGDYSQESQQRVFCTDAVYDGIIEDLTNPEFTWKKAVLFTSSIAQCEQTADRLRAAGLKCVTVHSNLGDQEEYNLLQFTHGLIPICVNVSILGKGFDFPPIDFVGLLIKTTSLSRYLQAIGRGSRVLEEEIKLPVEQRTKKQFYVFDYGKNVTKHLPWDYERNWQELWRGKPKREGVSPIKICPRCGYVNNAGVKTCVNCGYEWLTFAVPNNIPSAETILIEVTAKYNKLVGKNIKELTPVELADYAKSKGKQGFAQVICKWHAKHGNRDFIFAFAKAMNYKPYWAILILKNLDKLQATSPEEYDKLEIKDVILK